eukprot:5491912-Amphidinium_carterae.1
MNTNREIFIPGFSNPGFKTVFPFLKRGDDAFLFFVGRHIAICDYVQQKVAFLQRDARNRTITAATKSSNGKMLAISERLVSGSEDGLLQIVILSLPRDARSEPSKTEPLKVLHPANRRLNIIGLSFTTDAKYLVSLSGELKPPAS